MELVLCHNEEKMNHFEDEGDTQNPLCVVKVNW